MSLFIKFGAFFINLESAPTSKTEFKKLYKGKDFGISLDEAYEKVKEAKKKIS